MMDSTTSTQSAQTFSVPVYGSGNGLWMRVDALHFEDHHPYLDVSSSFGSLSLPLCAAPGLQNIDLQKIKTNTTNLSILKNYEGVSVFYLALTRNRKENRLLNKTLEFIKYTEATRWVLQGRNLKSDECITYRDTIFSKRQCFLKALSLSRKTSEVWTSLSTTLKGDNKIEVDGIFYNRRDCLLRALQLMNSAACWSNLGNALNSNETINIDNDILTKKQCYLKSLSIDKRCPITWRRLGSSLDFRQNESIKFNNTVIRSKDCFIKSLEIDITSITSWRSLAIRLEENEQIRLASKTYTQHECYVNALQLDAGDAELWSSVGSN